MKIKGVVVLLVTLPLLFACSDNDSTGVGVTMESVAGTYYASSAKAGSKLELVQGTTTTNGLAQGMTVLLTLKSNGATSGNFHVAATATQPASDEDLIGTWSLEGTQVKLSHATDTLLRDITFTADGKSLSGSLNTATSVASVVLVK